MLLFTYVWCGISPIKVWSNRHHARDYLLGRPLSQSDIDYIEDQERRAPSIEAQGRARAFQDNKYRGMPIASQPSLEEKFAENEALTAKFLAEMGAKEKETLRKKAREAARDEKRGGYFPPETAWSRVKGYLVALVETLAIAIWGTLLAIVCAVPVSLLAAKNTLALIITGDSAAARSLRQGCIFGVRRLLDACRGFNEFVMALIFVAVIGLGPFAGILALWIHTFGILGKVFSEQIEAIEDGQVEALSSTGAAVDQVIVFSVLPQVMPGVVSYSLLRFESNVRSAAILGFVGAGGIGFPHLRQAQRIPVPGSLHHDDHHHRVGGDHRFSVRKASAAVYLKHNGIESRRHAVVGVGAPLAGALFHSGGMGAALRTFFGEPGAPDGRTPSIRGCQDVSRTSASSS